ncbi:MAG: hypothetical protein HYS20_09100 [Rhodocyclales bacterium]|nr:hypothetical protein [Rhodocyclales bacterium]
MNTMPVQSGRSMSPAGVLRRATLLCVLAMCALSFAAHAEAPTSAGGTQSPAAEAGHAVGSTMRDIGEGARDAGKAVGHGVVSAGKAVGHFARDAGVKIGHAARDGAKGLARGIKGEND